MVKHFNTKLFKLYCVVVKCEETHVLQSMRRGQLKIAAAYT